MIKHKSPYRYVGSPTWKLLKGSSSLSWINPTRIPYFEIGFQVLVRFDPLFNIPKLICRRFEIVNNNNTSRTRKRNKNRVYLSVSNETKRFPLSPSLFSIIRYHLQIVVWTLHKFPIHNSFRHVPIRVVAHWFDVQFVRLGLWAIHMADLIVIQFESKFPSINSRIRISRSVDSISRFPAIHSSFYTGWLYSNTISKARPRPPLRPFTDYLRVRNDTSHSLNSNFSVTNWVYVHSLYRVTI